MSHAPTDADRAPRNSGPRTQDGKDRSRLNARTHGLTGSVHTLSIEDRADYDDRLARFLEELDPRDEAQHTLVGRIAFCAHRLDRIARQETAALDARIRQAPRELRRARMTRVLELGRRLMDDPVPRCDLGFEELDEPKIVAWRNDEPLLLVMELEETVQGCDWLLDRWRALGDVLESEGFLHYDNKYKLIRLLGKRPETLLEDRQVGDLVLACRALHPENWVFGKAARATCLGAENRPMYDKRVELLEARLPDLAAALNLLRATIDDAIVRLEELRAELEELWAIEQAEAAVLATFDASKEGLLRRRYETEYAREMHRSLALLSKREAGAPEPPAPAHAPEETKAPAEPGPRAGDSRDSRNELPKTEARPPGPHSPHAPTAPARAERDRPGPEIIDEY